MNLNTTTICKSQPIIYTLGGDKLERRFREGSKDFLKKEA